MSYITSRDVSLQVLFLQGLLWLQRQETGLLGYRPSMAKNQPAGLQRLLRTLKFCTGQA